MYIENHGVPRSIRLDQAKCLFENIQKTFSNKNGSEIIEALVSDNRAVGLVERLFKTIRNKLECIKEEKLANKAFHVKHAIKINIHQLRLCKLKTTNTSPFEAQFGRKSNIPLSVISTNSKISNLSYENVINH